MLTYPQLGTGALSQYPVRKRRRLRTIRNEAHDGSWIKCADPAAEITEWELAYSGLSDQEVEAIADFFRAAEGRLNDFTFVDPMGNLFAWSDQLDRADWMKDPWLSVMAGESDPWGGARAWHVQNDGGAPQGLSQTLNAPADYLYCLSAYARTAAPCPITLVMGSQRAARDINSNWTRVAFSAPGDAMRFGIELPAGAAIDLFGMQLEPQAAPSAYQPSQRGGVYENARLRDDRLTIRTTGINQHSCTVNIYHANHL